MFATALAYSSAIRGTYIWDDDAYVSNNPAVRSPDGLRRIWTDRGASPQYYPLVFTSFWIEHRLWGLRPLASHVINVGLHGLNAILLALVLQRLAVPGAWLAAALFALHPVHVESVAWITERKNVLSTAFYLSAMLACLSAYGVGPPDEAGSSWPIRWRAYAAALALLLGALLSKTVTCSFPAAMMVILWWRRDRIRKAELITLAPMFALGLAMGLVTAWIEQHHAGAQGEEWSLGLAERLLVAGRALWFYAGKLLWPSRLTFMYPRWELDVHSVGQWLFPLAVPAALFGLWALRSRIGKGPLAAVLLFAGTLLPALGFFNVYPMRYSFVADHFQYLASAGLIALIAAACSTAWRSFRLPVMAGAIGVAPVLALLGWLTWQQGQVYRNRETLWRDTLAKNPSSWMAHNNLGLVLFEQGRMAEAEQEFLETLQLKPDHPEANNNLGVILAGRGQRDAALARYEEAVRLKPNYAEAHNGLAATLVELGRLEEGIAHYRQAIRIQPGYAEAYHNLGLALAKAGRLDEAIKSYEQAIRLKPGYVKAHRNLGLLLQQQGRRREARKHLELGGVAPGAGEISQSRGMPATVGSAPAASR